MKRLLTLALCLALLCPAAAAAEGAEIAQSADKEGK